MRTLLLTACAAALLCGCASRASSVAPIAIPASDYAALSCDDTRAQLETSRAREAALTRQQNNAATTDAAMVFLFALPLGSVFGADHEGELAQAKGEALALQRAVTINCAPSRVGPAPAHVAAAPAPAPAQAPAEAAAAAPSAPTITEAAASTPVAQ